MDAFLAIEEPETAASIFGAKTERGLQEWSKMRASILSEMEAEKATSICDAMVLIDTASLL